MAEFCEGCPMKGRVEGEIYALAEGDMQLRFIPGVLSRVTEPLLLGSRRAGALVDDELKPSMPIWLGAVENADTLRTKIDKCEGPLITESKKLFRQLKIEFHCPAIGRLAIDHKHEAFDVIAEQVNL